MSSSHTTASIPVVSDVPTDASAPTTSQSPGGDHDEEASPRIKLKRAQRMFVNRSLNLGDIKAIGFDLDHTLALYDREAFESLAFRKTLEKFIGAGYPEELSTLTFDPGMLIRGLLVDMDRGNVLKVDGHKYVKVAYHGRQRLSKEERRKLYNSHSFKAGEFLSVDTFFALSEVQLFCELVDFMDRNPGRIPKTYREVYHDLRHFIDLSHADGSIKTEVLAAPERFLVKDRHLAPTLASLIEAGKELFLLTNSGWEYTDRLLNYLFDEPQGELRSWRDYFAHVIVGAGKPGFFTGSQPFYEVMTDSGLLRPSSGPLLKGRVYHGGNARLFEKLTAWRGDAILFVGDHIYGDIARSKDTLAWRTMLVVEELASELEKLEAQKPALTEIHARLTQRETLDEELQRLRSKILSNSHKAERMRTRGEVKKLQYLLEENAKLEVKAREKQEELASRDADVQDRIKAREAAIHPIWGELMRAGLERSRFADQVASYACIYTPTVTNLRFYSAFKRFSAALDKLPHEP